MSFSVDCCQPSCCPSTTVVNVPGIPGTDGADGAPGAAGQSAFTLTTADFIVPPADNATPVTVAVASTTWLAVGAVVFIPGAGFMLVVAIVDGTHVQLKSPAWEANTHAGETISAAAKVVASGWQPAAPSLPSVAPISKYGSGTAYVIAAAGFAEVVFGTSANQEITLTTAGVWLLQARARVDYVGATFAAVRTASFKLQKQAGPVDVANSATAFKTDIITTLTYTACDVVFPPVIYTTANVNDVIQMMAMLDVVPSAGDLKIVEASIVATFLHA